MDRSEAPDNGVDADGSTPAHPPASIVELPDMLEPGDSVVEPTPTPTSVSATDALPTDEAKGPFKGAQETVHTPGESSEADRDSARAHVPRAEANTGAGSAGGAQRGTDGDEEGEDADGESEPEEELTEEAIALRLASADAAKLQGNDFFKNGDWEQAAEAYGNAIKLCPSKNAAGAPYFANRAACHLKVEKYASCIDDATKALELQPIYPKVTLRRAIANEKLDHFEEALADFNAVLELEPDNDFARSSAQRLQPIVDAQREKLKEDMMGNLKKLGNVFLKPFGLSTENFKMQQNAEGGYSVNFEQ